MNDQALGVATAAHFSFHRSLGIVYQIRGGLSRDWYAVLKIEGLPQATPLF
jgi:hypothetical protein